MYDIELDPSPTVLPTKHPRVKRGEFAIPMAKDKATSENDDAFVIPVVPAKRSLLIYSALEKGGRMATSIGREAFDIPMASS